MASKPQLFILAGPNGSGKTTVAEFLIANKSLPRFVNADFIAKGLNKGESSLGDIDAGRIMLQKLHSAIELGESIAFETTLSGKMWQRLIDKATRAGFETTICYVAVRNPDIACERVHTRTLEGGHFVAEADIRRRYFRSLTLFLKLYSTKVRNWYFFDNSDASAVLVACKENGDKQKVFLEDILTSYQSNYGTTRN